MPVLNEAEGVVACLTPLQRLREQGHEIILADGGSEDDTVGLAQSLVDKVIASPKGRARQMNAAAAKASGELLLFLHADTLLPKNAEVELQAAMKTQLWGRFDVSLSGSAGLLRVIERMMNLRSRLSGIATGDQAIFVRRDIFQQQGGFDDIPLMEDVALSKKLKRLSSPFCSRLRVVTSSRRWEEYGLWRTIFLMWRLRWAYFRGVSPDQLVSRYYAS
jgi:rSAM/selenodomain-associated transferase 2